jgi:phage gp45-like
VDPYISMLEQRIERLERALRQQVAISRSTAPAIDTGMVQVNQGQIDPLTVLDGMPTLLNYGFSSSMPIGGDKAVIFLNGDRSQGVVVATGHRQYRFIGLQEGEAVMHDMWGHSLRLSAAGATLVGNLSVTGSITAGSGGADSVTLQDHRHGGGTPPTAGT